MDKKTEHNSSNRGGFVRTNVVSSEGFKEKSNTTAKKRKVFELGVLGLTIVDKDNGKKKKFDSTFEEKNIFNRESKSVEVSEEKSGISDDMGLNELCDKKGLDLELTELVVAIIKRSVDFLLEGEFANEKDEIDQDLDELDEHCVADLDEEDRGFYEERIENYIAEVNEENKTDFLQEIAKAGNLGYWLEVLGRLEYEAVLTEGYCQKKLMPQLVKEDEDGKSALMYALEHKNFSHLFENVSLAVSKHCLDLEWVMDFLAMPIKGEGKSVVQKAIDQGVFGDFWKGLARKFVREIKAIDPKKCIRFAIMPVEFNHNEAKRSTSLLEYMKDLKLTGCDSLGEIVKAESMRLQFIEETGYVKLLKPAKAFEEWMGAVIGILMEPKEGGLNEYDYFKLEKIIQEICKLDKKECNAVAVLRAIFSKMTTESKQSVWHSLASKGVLFSRFLNFVVNLVQEGFLSKGYVEDHLLHYLMKDSDSNGFYAYQMAVRHSKDSLDMLLRSLYKMVDARLLPAGIISDFIFMDAGHLGFKQQNVFSRIMNEGLEQDFFRTIPKYWNDFDLNQLKRFFEIKFLKKIDSLEPEHTEGVPRRMLTGVYSNHYLLDSKPTISLARVGVERNYWTVDDVRKLLKDKGASMEYVNNLLPERNERIRKIL